MIVSVRKRDGREMPFNIEKIVDAIVKAFRASGELDEQIKAAQSQLNLLGNDDVLTSTALKVSADVVGRLESEGKNIPEIEEIQDAVEKALTEGGYADTAKSYILYRAERTRVREVNTRLMHTLRDITFSSAKESDLKRENANIDGDTAMGTMLKYGSESAKHFYTMMMLKPEHSRAHSEGDIHIHDLDFYSLTMTCCQIDLKKLFKGGFNTGHGHLREPKDIRSYAALAAIAIQSNQNDQHGGQSIPNFDYAMADGVRITYRKAYLSNLVKALILFTGKEEEEILPGVKKLHAEMAEMGMVATLVPNEKFVEAEARELSKVYDAEIVKKAQKFAEKQAYEETDKTTFQAMEAVVHNLNSMHSRAGAQVPFTSINFGTDTTPAGRLVSLDLLQATENGLGKGETPIFPISILKVKEGINYNPEDPNYDIFKRSMEVSAKRLFPNFCFIDAPYNLKYYKKGDYRTEIATMGCRTRVFASVFPESDGIVTGRGNLSFTTVNLVRIGIKHGICLKERKEADWEGFYKELDEKMDLVRDELLERFDFQANQHVRNFPFLMGQGNWFGSEKLGPNDTLRDVIKHGTLSIGFIGLAETLVAMTGKHHGEDEDARDLGLDIVTHMRERCDSYSKKHKLNFSLLATPAEGIAGRFTKIDRKEFGKIKGVTDREFYTNSFHVPVYYPISAFEKIEIEAPYHNLCNAGHITYIELDGDPSQNIAAFESVIRKMHDEGIGYGSVNHPVDRDPVCGFSGIITGDRCPHCGRLEGDLPFEKVCNCAKGE